MIIFYTHNTFSLIDFPFLEPTSTNTNPVLSQRVYEVDSPPGLNTGRISKKRKAQEYPNDEDASGPPELTVKDQQISSLQEERGTLQRSIDEDVTGKPITLLKEQLDQERQNNREITKGLAELAGVESAKSELEKKVEQLTKDKEELQRLALEHEETVKTTKA
ncbi:hypothetical protein AC579_5535 [Pseudocercospora musae]|uniref:Uncharacterized protein n=1 Tax=Pseudocercospora musae TaxID=113226 RepID=A0A139IMK8_9PEZI|nr:hypothetical protein AC579_5535 [Pseudocercospora musae]